MGGHTTQSSERYAKFVNDIGNKQTEIHDINYTWNNGVQRTENHVGDDIAGAKTVLTGLNN